MQNKNPIIKIVFLTLTALSFSSVSHAESIPPLTHNLTKVKNQLPAPALKLQNMDDEIVDIKELNKPTLLKSYTMYNPHGLGIDQGTLFICDGEDGLKIYDAKDPLMLKSNMLAHFTEINTFDVIPVNDRLIMIGTDGLYQYDYSDLTEINLLSKIPIGN